MKEPRLLSTIGLLIYVIASIFNRFIKHIPDAIYIPIVLAALVLCFVGIWLDRRKK